MKFKHSKHPKWGNNGDLYYISDNTTKLIIGTMPPSRICDGELKPNDFNFFYGSKDNYFWNIMNFLNSKSKICDLNNISRFDSVDACKKFLDNNKIGLIDIIKECDHKLGVNGKPLASDNTIYNIIPIDLLKILKEYKNVDTIFYTGEEVLKLLKKYYSVKICKKMNIITFENIDKIYKIYKLYSPTKRVFNNPKNDKVEYLKNYYKIVER